MHLVDHNVDRNIAEIAAYDENRKCFECGGQALWASVSLGMVDIELHILIVKVFFSVCPMQEITDTSELIYQLSGKRILI
jgi:hypothetical protein